MIRQVGLFLALLTTSSMLKAGSNTSCSLLFALQTEQFQTRFSYVPYSRGTPRAGENSGYGNRLSARRFSRAMETALLSSSDFQRTFQDLAPLDHLQLALDLTWIDANLRTTSDVRTLEGLVSLNIDRLNKRPFEAKQLTGLWEVFELRDGALRFKLDELELEGLLIQTRASAHIAWRRGLDKVRLSHSPELRQVQIPKLIEELAKSNLSFLQRHLEELRALGQTP